MREKSEYRKFVRCHLNLIVSCRILSNRIYRDDRDIRDKIEITEIYRRRLNYMNVIYSAYQTNY